VAAAPAASVGREPQNDQTLFASNVVVSRRTGPDAVLTPVPRPSPSSVEPGERPTADPAIPSLDDVTRSVMRALPPPAPPAAVADAAPRSAPPSPVNGPRVSEGTVFDAVLVNRLEGSFAGPVNALITAPVYAQDLTLVIPAGARVLGTSVRVQELDAARLAVAFHRVLLPDGRDVSLDTFVGTNVQGTPGLSGHVNRHYVSTFGAAAAVGLITGLAQWVGSGFGTADATVVIAGGIGDSTSQAASQTMARFLNRLPTVTVREGSRLKIYVTSDLTLPRYEGGAK
jgi:type IV secretion system protein VirB10